MLFCIGRWAFGVCLLYRVLNLALVHEGDLKIEIDPTDYQEKDEHDVRDRRMEITAYFAREESVKLTHGLSKTNGS